MKFVRFARSVKTGQAGEFFAIKGSIQYTMQLSTTTHGELHFKKGIPGEAAPPVIVPGSTAHSATGSFGNISLQRFTTRHFGFRYSLYRIREDTELHLVHDGPVMGFRVLLRGHIRHRFQRAGDIYLQQGQFNFGYLPSVDSTCLLSPGYDYQLFDMWVDPHFVEQSVAGIRLPESFTGRMGQNEKVYLLEDYAWAHIPFLEAIENFLKRPHDIMMAEKTVSAMLQSAAAAKKGTGLTEERIEKVYCARDLIKKNIPQHLQIPEIAQRCGVNENYLKHDFMQVFGMSPYKYLKYERLVAVKALLRKTPFLPLQVIAERTGFLSAPSLITVFNKLEGVTPDKWRKHSGNFIMLLLFSVRWITIGKV